MEKINLMDALKRSAPVERDDIDGYCSCGHHKSDQCESCRGFADTHSSPDRAILSPALIGAIVAAMALRVEQAPPQATDQAKADLETVKRWADNHAVPQPSAATGDADEYEKRIREKLFNSGILTSGEWVYLVGLFQTAREHEGCGSGPQEVEEQWRQALRDLREVAIAEGFDATKRRIFDLIMDGPSSSVTRPEHRAPSATSPDAAAPSQRRPE